MRNRLKRCSQACRWRLRCAGKIGLMMGLLGCPVTAHAFQEEPLGAGIGGWVGDGVQGFQDGTVSLMKMTEVLGGKFVFSLAPMLEYGATVDLTQFGLSRKTKYWVGVRLPQFASKLNLESDFGFLSNELNRSDSSVVLPFGAGLNIPLGGRTSFTANFLLNVAPSGEGLLPAIIFGIRF